MCKAGWETKAESQLSEPQQRETGLSYSDGLVSSSLVIDKHRRSIEIFKNISFGPLSMVAWWNATPFLWAMKMFVFPEFK
jgi:hypothetical protein